MYSFEEDKETNTITVMINGESKQFVEQIAKMLEINSLWPVVPIAVEALYHVLFTHMESKEKLRNLVLISDDEDEGGHILDIEQIKVNAKKMEVRGLE